MIINHDSKIPFYYLKKLDANNISIFRILNYLNL